MIKLDSVIHFTTKAKCNYQEISDKDGMVRKGGKFSESMKRPAVATSDQAEKKSKVVSEA